MLKFDTHGFEVPILKGAAQHAGETRYIVMEVYNYRHVEGTLLFYEMCALLDGWGFGASIWPIRCSVRSTEPVADGFVFRA